LGDTTLVTCPRAVLSTLLLPTDAPAMNYAAPYLRWRALGMIPSLIGATGSAAYRGLLDTVNCNPSQGQFIDEYCQCHFGPAIDDWHLLHFILFL
jgi:hypothetical protein